MAGCEIRGKGSLILCVIFFLILDLSLTEYNEKLELLISKIDAGVSFYEQNYKSIDLDGIFGLRIIEGELLFLISQSEYAFDSTSKLPSGLIKRLKALQERARLTAENALPILQSQDSVYYKKVGYLVESAWRPTVYYRKLSQSSRWPPGNPAKRLTESISDGCIQELRDSILQQSDNPDLKGSCRFSNKCIEFMLQQKNTYGYGILHQVMYIQVVQKLGCITALNGILIRNGTNAYQLTAELCSNVYEEMTKKLAETDTFRRLNSFDSDLFCEQVFVCSNVGYMEFVNISYLSHILSWQQSSGCFRPPESTLDSSHHFGFRPWRHRHLLRTAALRDGCNSHMTAVALGALSAYLRLFLDFNIQMYFPDFPSFPRLIIEERNEIQRRNLPRLIDDKGVEENEKRRYRMNDKTKDFKPLWPGYRPEALRVPSVGHLRNIVEDNLEVSEPSDSRPFSVVRTLLNWMFIFSILMTVGVLFRKGYVIRLMAFLYRRQHSACHTV